MGSAVDSSMLLLKGNIHFSHCLDAMEHCYLSTRCMITIAVTLIFRLRSSHESPLSTHTVDNVVAQERAPTIPDVLHTFS